MAAKDGDVALFGKVLHAMPNALRDSLCELHFDGQIADDFGVSSLIS